jgi:predicted nuclease of predicted toxin-antitoxin system
MTRSSASTRHDPPPAPPRLTAHRSAAFLSANGFDAQHVADIGLARASDADFHRLLAASGASRPSVIRIRREGLRGMEVAALIGRVIARLGQQIEQGVVVTVTERSIRVRRLPII